MSRAQHAAAAVCALLLTAPVTAAARCELVLSEHRSGRELARMPVDAALPTASVAFIHSVLGTPVADRYEWRGGRAHLVEERFEGDGYGLPNAAGPGESMTRDGDGWRLQLDRVVDPLVLRAVQGMRLTIAGQPSLPLGTLGSTRAIALQAQGCATNPPGPARP